MRRFLEFCYPGWNTKLVSSGFEFDPKQLHNTEGVPDEARRRVQEEDLKDSERFKFEKWTENVVAQEAECKVIRMLEERFYKDVGVLISGYKETSLCNIVKCLNSGQSQSKLSEQVKC